MKFHLCFLLALVIPMVALAQPAPEPSAWDLWLQEAPKAARNLSPLDRRALQALTPQQAEAYLQGLSADRITLSDGTTLMELLSSTATPSAPGTVKGQQKISDLAGGFQGTLADHNFFGVSVAPVGDLDGDGLQELAVGGYVNIHDGHSPADLGSVWILFLHPNGQVRSEQEISLDTGGFTGLIEGEDAFGSSVAPLGDLDGDGTPDLAVGARWDDDGGTDRGAVWILFLRPDGTVKAQRKISSTSGDLPGGSAGFSHFGIGLGSVGDLDGDGSAELAVGAIRSVWILDLNEDGSVRSAQKISTTEGGFGGVLAVDSHFGVDVNGVGDIDGDGVPDLAVGDTRDSDGGRHRGAVWLFFMNPDGTVRDEQKISALQGGFSGRLEDDDRFGTVAALGDLDGDAVPDLAVGAVAADDGGTNQGAVWILFLRADGTVKDQQKISELAGGFTGDLDPFDAFGFGLEAIGDLNGDEIIDLVAGTRLDDDGGPRRGAAWILFLNGTPSSAPRADFSASETAGVAPLRVQFVNTSSFTDPAAAVFAWDFDGDGVVDSAEENPAFTYTEAGTFSVRLTVTEGALSDTVVRADLVTVVEPANVAPVALPGTSLDAAGRLQLDGSLSSDADADPLSYSWQIDNGVGLRSGEKVLIDDLAPGNYGVILTVSDGTTSTVAPLLLGIPESFTAAGLTVDFTTDVTSGAPPLQVAFTAVTSARNTTISSIAWDFDGDGVTDSTEPNPTFVYEDLGTFSVRLTISDGTLSATELKSELVTVAIPEEAKLYCADLPSAVHVVAGPAPDDCPNRSLSPFQFQLLDSHCQPLAGVRVNLRRENGSFLDHTFTDTTGMADFTIADSTASLFEVDFQGARQSTLAGSFQTGASVQTRSFGLTLLSSACTPVSGARVNLRRTNDAFVTHRTTDIEGRAAFEALPVAALKLQVDFNGGALATESLASTQAVVVGLESYKFHLLDSTGGPTPGARVNLRRGNDAFVTSTTTNSLGLAQFDVVPTAPMKMEVDFNGDAIRLPASTAHTLETVQTRVLGAAVQASDGQPIAGARVNLRRANGAFVTNQTTGTPGEARFEVLPGASMILELDYNGDTFRTEVTDLAAETLVPIRTFAFTLRFVDGAEQPIEGARVNLRRANGAFVSSRSTGADGRARFEVVPGGQAILEVDFENERQDIGVQTITADTEITLVSSGL